MRLLGDRIKHARTSTQLSQAQLAAALSEATGTKVSKSLVSQWELNKVKSPNTTNLLALQAITGFRAEWMLHGTMPQKIEGSTGFHKNKPADIDIVLLERIVFEVVKTTTDPKRAAKAIARMYQSLSSHDGKLDPLTLLARYATSGTD
jgi:transcriptional regulator with XRE-family HTH domain